MRYSKSTSLKVFLNHEEICIGSRVLLKDLLASKSITGAGVSVAVNNRIIDPKDWPELLLNGGDNVTVVSKTSR